MTYEELADLLGCTVAQAHERAQHELLDRKISRDGRKRAKLNTELVVLFIHRLRTIDLMVDEDVNALRHIYGLLQPAHQPAAFIPSLRRRIGG
jgi:hypothetical protein